MEPLPASIADLADSIEWPDPDASGTTTLSPETLQRIDLLIGGLIHYIQSQLTLCKVE